MTSLFHFKDNVHCRSLPRALSMPLLFPRLLYQIIVHIGFLTDPRVERRRGYEATLTIDRWRAMPRGFHLPPPGSDEDEPTDYSPRGDLSPIAEHVMALIRGAVSRHALGQRTLSRHVMAQGRGTVARHGIRPRHLI